MSLSSQMNYALPQMSRAEMKDALDEAQFEFDHATKLGCTAEANSWANEIIAYKIEMGYL